MMLIDTSGFFAVYSEKDKNHISAKEAYQNSRLRITTNYVLAEYVALALIRGLPRDQGFNLQRRGFDGCHNRNHLG